MGEWREEEVERKGWRKETGIEGWRNGRDKEERERRKGMEKQE